MSLATPWACLTLQILVLSCTLCTYTETLTPLFSPGMMSTASSLSMVSTNWLIHSCLFAQIALSLNLWGTPEHNITLTLFNLQVQTLIRIQFSLNLSLPPPLMPVILPWYWTLWPPCEERCTSSKTGIADKSQIKYLNTEVHSECFLFTQEQVYELICVLVCSQLLLA